MSSHLSCQKVEEEYYPEYPLLSISHPAAVNSSSTTPYLVQPFPASLASQNSSWATSDSYQNFPEDTSLLYPTYNNPSFTSSAISHQTSPVPSAVQSPSFSTASTVSANSNMNSPPNFDNFYFDMNNFQMGAAAEMTSGENVDTSVPLMATGWEQDIPVMSSANVPMMPHQFNNWCLPLDTCDYENSKAPLFPQASTYASEASNPYSTPVQPAAPVASVPQSARTYQQATPLNSGKKRRASSSSPDARRTKRTTTHAGESIREKCPYAGCGRSFKDLKAHMLTHQSERPEKCPLVSCEYHIKGFARKYDKNRHTLTHYRGTMVCGFCPGAGTTAETSFDRADAFKKHLISVHKVEQTAPNCRKRSPSALEAGSRGDLEQYCVGATGKCSTCGGIYGNAQNFYEHLDECVLKAVFPISSSESINARHLTEISKDEAVKETLRRSHVYDAVSPETNLEHNGYDSEGSNANAFFSAQDQKDSISVNTDVTHPLSVANSHANRTHYPPAWGIPASELTQRRRLINVFNGPRRIWRDEMKLHNNYEVRLRLPQTDERGREIYVTDLDVASLQRSEALHNASEEERGPWIADAINDRGLMGRSAVSLLPPQ